MHAFATPYLLDAGLILDMLGPNLDDTSYRPGYRTGYRTSYRTSYRTTGGGVPKTTPLHKPPCRRTFNRTAASSQGILRTVGFPCGLLTVPIERHALHADCSHQHYNKSLLKWPAVSRSAPTTYSVSPTRLGYTIDDPDTNRKLFRFSNYWLVVL